MAWKPEFKLYSSDGLSLLYTFPGVQYTNAPRSLEEVIEVTNVRSKGSLFIEGGMKAWNLDMRFVITGSDYEDITAKIDALESAVEFNTAYILRIDRTTSTFYEYKIKRLSSFEYIESLRNTIQKVNSKFIVNSW